MGVGVCVCDAPNPGGPLTTLEHFHMHYAIFKTIYTICQYAYFQSTTTTHM